MAAEKTYDSIASSTLTTSSNSIIFSSIPSTFTDLVLVTSGTSPEGVAIAYRFNGDTSSNYYDGYLYGDAGGVGRGVHSGDVRTYGGVVNTSISTGILQIQNYSNVNIRKPFIIKSGTGTTANTLFAGYWSSTSAINSIEVFNYQGNFDSGFIASLYGITCA